MTANERTRTIGRQVFTGYAATLLILLLLLAVALIALVQLDRAHTGVVQHDVPQVVGAQQLGRIAAEIAVGNRGYLISGDSAQLEALDGLDLQFVEVFADMERRVRTEDGGQLLGQVLAAKEAWDIGRGRAFAEAPDLETPERLALIEDHLIGPYRNMTDILEQTIAFQNDRIARDQAEANRQSTIAIALVVALGIAGVVVAVIIGGRTVRSTGERLRAVVRDIDSTTSEILAGTTQQVAGAAEQAAAVQQTVTSVEELTQTAGQSAERARSVADGAQRSAEVAEAGTQSVEATAAGMEQIRMQVDSIAATVLALTEHTAAISDIVGAVDDISERTHLLALNASVEAARAGEHGRGFAVVAGEIRALAEEARRATARVGKLLAEIQRGATTAVMATEEGTKSVEEGVRRVADAGSTIRELADTINAATLAAEQIAASSNQQAVATTQIDQGMRNIDEVMEQNVASARQMEEAVRGLDDVATRLKDLVGAGSA